MSWQTTLLMCVLFPLFLSFTNKSINLSQEFYLTHLLSKPPWMLFPLSNTNFRKYNFSFSKHTYSVGINFAGIQHGGNMTKGSLWAWETQFEVIPINKLQICWTGSCSISWEICVQFHTKSYFILAITESATTALNIMEARTHWAPMTGIGFPSMPLALIGVSRANFLYRLGKIIPKDQ